MLHRLLIVIAFLPSALLAQTAEERIAALESRVRALEEKSKTPQPAPAAAKPKTGIPAGKLSLEKWSHTYAVGKFDEPGYNLGIKIANGYYKPIKLIDGTCIYRDALGEAVFSAALQKDVKIPAGGSVEIGGFYTFNRFEDGKFRLKNMDKSDVTAHLQIRRIVFSDNTIIEVERE